MKVNITKDDLNGGLSVVSRVVTGKGQLPVLGNVLLEAEKTGLSLAGTNLELGLRAEVGGKVTEEGKITVPGRSLSEFVNSLMASSQVELETDGEKLKIKAGKFGATFAGIAATEFPILPRVEESKSGRVKVSRKIIGEIARQVAYAAAADESRPVLTGVQFRVDSSWFMVTATDGFRLARKKIQDSRFKVQEDLDGLILPARTILELARVIGEGGTDDVGMEVVKENNQVIFKAGKVEVISRVLEGNYPEVDKIIPNERKTRVVLDKAELERAVKAAGIFARENNNIIKFRITNNELRISAAAKESGESEIEIEVEKFEGEEGDISFNYRYVMDYLGSVDKERVILEMSGNLAPGVWKAEGEEGLTALIMPVRV
ncbi:DNA polymerase III subunit beta [Candidatus Amesbacteria bacterium]|nr:DNA polymerase III subunit beta [Candidatus Amesbacteria bacterium]